MIFKNIEIINYNEFVLRLYLENCCKFDEVDNIKDIYIKYAGYLANILIGYRDMNHNLPSNIRFIAIKCIIGYRDFEVNLIKNSYKIDNKYEDYFDVEKYKKELFTFNVLKSII